MIYHRDIWHSIINFLTWDARISLYSTCHYFDSWRSRDKKEERKKGIEIVIKHSPESNVFIYPEKDLYLRAGRYYSTSIWDFNETLTLLGPCQFLSEIYLHDCKVYLEGPLIICGDNSILKNLNIIIPKYDEKPLFSCAGAGWIEIRNCSNVSITQCILKPEPFPQKPECKPSNVKNIKYKSDYGQKKYIQKAERRAQQKKLCY